MMVKRLAGRQKEKTPGAIGITLRRANYDLESAAYEVAAPGRFIWQEVGVLAM
jgi:hypothetical protein